MSLYFTDEVQITNVTRDQNFRTETFGTPYLSEAYVEEEDRINYSEGIPIQPIRRIFIPYNEDNVVAIGDNIKVTKLRGRTVTDTDRKVVSAFQVGSFEESHLEIVAGGSKTG